MRELKKVLLLCFLLFAGGVSAQDTSGKYVHGNIRVAELETVPTRPEDQRAGEVYIGDHKVLRFLSYSTSDLKTIKTLLNSETFGDSNNVKTCVFMPKYGILGDKKISFFPLFKVSRAEVVVSMDPCGRIFMRKDGQDRYKDLSSGNQLERILEKAGSENGK